MRRVFNAVELLLNAEGWPTLRRHEGGLSSGEGLGWSIRDRIEDSEGKDNGGTEDKRLYVVESEFGGTIDVANREKNTLSAIIRTVFDGKTISPLVKNAAWSATNPHICITGHITSAELIAKMSDVDAHSGFLNRFVILHIVRPKLVPLPSRTHAEDIDRVAAQVVESVRFAVGIDITASNTLEVTLSAEAIKFWCDQYPALTAECDGIGGALLVRTEIYARMLAMIFALLDKTNVIEVQHIKAALAWVNYWRDSVQYIFATLAAKAEAERLKDAASDVLEFIRQHPGCTRTELTLGFKNKIFGQQITECLNHLMNAAPPLVRYQQMPRPDGKPGKSRTLYWAL